MGLRFFSPGHRDHDMPDGEGSEWVLHFLTIAGLGLLALAIALMLRLG